MTKLQKFRVIHMPELRVVSTERVSLHEWFDTKRTKALKKKIIDSGKWKDPPIVTELTEGRYMVLDGANRTTSMKALKIPHMLVQLVDYFDPSIELTSWNHLIKLSADTLITTLHNVNSRLKLGRANDLKARRMLRKRQILAYICDGKGRTYTIPIQSSAKKALDVLNALAKCYEGKSVIHRTEESTHKAFHGQPRSFTTLVVYPALTKVGILKALRRGQFLPTGISRHLILRRALRVYLPLSVLRSRKLSVRRKQMMVDRMISKLSEKGKIRYYPEGIYLYDE